MNRLQEWYFIQIKMSLGRPITRKDVLEHFHKHSNQESLLKVKITIGNSVDNSIDNTVVVEWNAHDLIKEFEAWQLKSNN